MSKNQNKAAKQHKDAETEVNPMSGVSSEGMEPYADPIYEDACENADADMNLKLQLEKENSIALTNMLKQLQADFDNYRKRNQTATEDARLKGIAEAVKALLPAYDAVLNALKLIQDEQVLEGMRMVEREYLKALESLSVTPIAAVGEVFDPNLHNVIMAEEAEGKQSGEILEEIQRGFTFPGGVIRYSVVKVAK